MKATLVFLAAAAVAVLALLPSVTVSGGARGAGWQDEGPDGGSQLASSLAQGAQVRVLEGSLAALPSSAGPRDVLFLFPTHRPATPLEADAVDAFVRQGGTLVVASDGGNGAAWGTRFGFQVQEIPVLLPPGNASSASASAASTNASCVPAQGFLADGSTLPVCLPSPTAFADLGFGAPGAGRVGPLAANSTVPVVLDLDLNGNVSLGDQGPRTFAMALRLPHGAGAVVALADGDALRNQALQRSPQNLAWAQALAGGARTVYLDATAADASVAGRAAAAATRTVGAPDWPAAGALVLVLAAAAAAAACLPRLSAWRRHDPVEGEDPILESSARTILARADQSRRE